jgi:hypothetical protein
VVAPVVRAGACQFRRNNPDAVSAGRFDPIVTAEHQPPVTSQRPFHLRSVEDLGHQFIADQ